MDTQGVEQSQASHDAVWRSKVEEDLRVPSV